jgi:hypothetical protein
VQIATDPAVNGGSILLERAHMRELVHAAFHALDDSEDDGSDSIKICREDYDDLNAALDNLGIEGHEDITRLFGEAP